MPILKLYTTQNQLTSAEKAELAKVLTAGYSRIMPAFFVNIMFHEVCNRLFLTPPISSPLDKGL